MTIIGWYYLHTNGELIYKPGADQGVDLRESTFVRGLWPLDPEDRATAWNLLVEALASGAQLARIKDLANKWHCTDSDADNYAKYLNAGLQIEGDSWCAIPPWFVNLQESPAGFGDTCLEALADLCRQLGYKPTKMWGASFRDLLVR